MSFLTFTANIHERDLTFSEISIFIKIFSAIFFLIKIDVSNFHLSFGSIHIQSCLNINDIPFLAWKIPCFVCLCFPLIYYRFCLHSISRFVIVWRATEHVSPYIDPPNCSSFYRITAKQDCKRNDHETIGNT